MIRFVELFCGIGGFRLGLEQANMEISTTSQQRIGSVQRGCNSQPQNPSPTFTCVWANDHDKYASQIYRKNFGDEELVEADIRTVNVNTIPDHDLLTAGFPCQSFSVAGKRMGFQDTRGTLFYEICRVAKAKRPSLLLLENVKGLLSHDEGLTYQIILESLAELGYWCEWQVLNSKHYGVPQNRERVFIVGHLTGTGGREVFPLLPGDKEIDKQQSRIPQQTASTIQSSQYKITRGMTILRVGGLYDKNGETHQAGSVYDTKGISPILDTAQGGHRQPLVYATLTPDRVEKRQHGRRFKEDGEPMFTLTGQDIHGVSLDEKRIRRLTPVECERLQGFPDNWTQGVSDTQRYKCLGNAVTVNVIKFLGTKMAFATSNTMIKKKVF